jgi:hypothetical protein
MTKTDMVPEDLKVYAVTTSGKIYWAKRNSRGQFVNAYGRNRADDIRADHAAYVEHRTTAAERATKGFMLTPAGTRRGIRPEDVMTGRRSLRWATEELRQWMLTHGRTMGITAFRTQAEAA